MLCPLLAWAGDAAVVLAGKPLSEGQVLAGIQHCLRDAPELELAACFAEYIVPLHRLDLMASRKPAESNADRQARATVLYRALYDRVEAEVAVSADDVTDYLSRHEREFNRPLRLRLFRILVGSETLAKQILADLGPDTTPAEFRALARQHSKDASTAERGGDLGFVWPDGSTDVPQLRADRALYAAAEKVADGAFVAQPVSEGQQFAIVWRRGSLPPWQLSKEESSEIASARIVERRTREALDAIVEKKSPHISGGLLKKLKRPSCRIFEQ